jgi:hypothetical protein
VLCGLTRHPRRCKNFSCRCRTRRVATYLALGRPFLAFLKLEKKDVGCGLESRF